VYIYIYVCVCVCLCIFTRAIYIERCIFMIQAYIGKKI